MADDAHAASDSGALQSQLDELADQLSDLRGRVSDQADDARQRLEPFVDEVKSNWESVKRAVDHLGTATADAVKEASQQTEAGIQGLRSDLGTVRADLSTELADSRDGYRAAVRDLTDSWRARIDQLRVQADLARMDARDEIEDDLAKAEGLWADLKRRADELGDEAGDATADLREDVTRLVGDLRAALRRALDRLRDDG